MRDYDWLVCDTCACYIANNDATSLDYYYEEEKAAEVLATMNKSLEEANGYAVLNFDELHGFSSFRCDCCKCLAGNRHMVSFLSLQEVNNVQKL